MLKEFREFIMRGNVLDLAVAVVIGAAFGTIVTSLVNDVIMPPIGYLLGNVDFSNILIELGTNDDGEVVAIRIGLFINAIINFLIVAAAIFFVVRAINSASERFKKEEAAAEEAPAEPTTEEKLLEAVEKLNKLLDEKLQ